MNFSFSSISSALTDLTETGVSFEGKAINWATAENGKFFFGVKIFLFYLKKKIVFNLIFSTKFNWCDK